MQVTPQTQTTACDRADVFNILRIADRQLSSQTNTAETPARLINPLIRCASIVDAETTNHVHRVAGYARHLAQACGWTGWKLDHLTIAATLHDIGKIGVRPDLLSKPGRLSPTERRAVERHTILANTLLRGCKSPLLGMIREVATHHHERWDASGYPNGLGGPEIPLAARIVSLADVYDALTSDRPYRRALSQDAALAMIAEGAGTQFDPVLAVTFLNLHASAWKCA